MRKIIKTCCFIFPLVAIFLSTNYPTIHAGAVGLQFEKEKIRIKISEDEYRLVGDYYFNNSDAKVIRQKIFYPIIKNLHLPFPHFFKVTNVLKNQTVSFTKAKNGISFWIEIPPFSKAVYRVEYQQKALNKKLEYILTTTSKWGKPLKSAEFLIVISLNCELEHISIPFDSESEDSKTKSYFIHKKNFNPQKNLIIEWRCENDHKSN